MNFEIRRLTEDEFLLWDDFVGQSMQGTIFHTSNWLNASGQKFIIYGCFENESLAGGFPVACISRFGLKQAIHPPLTPYLGVVFDKKERKYVSRISYEKRISGAIAKTIKKDFDGVRFNFSPFFPDLQPFIWEDFSCDVRYTYMLYLRDLGNTWKNMDDSRRNDIRKAEKDGLSVEFNNDFEKTFALVQKTFHRQNKIPKFRCVALEYDRILAQKDQRKAFLARDKEGEPIAVVYIVWDKKRSYYLLGGYDPEKKHHGASAIALWEAIKFTKEKLRLDEFDFEGSMIPQVEFFFRKFGGRLTPYYSVAWTRPSLRFVFSARKAIGKGLTKLGLG